MGSGCLDSCRSSPNSLAVENQQNLDFEIIGILDFGDRFWDFGIIFWDFPRIPHLADQSSLASIDTQRNWFFASKNLLSD